MPSLATTLASGVVAASCYTNSQCVIYLNNFYRDHPVLTITAGIISIAMILYLLLPKKKKMVPLKLEAKSFVAPGFEEVKGTFEINLESGLEKGGAFAAYYKGELVVNLFGGHADEGAQMTWKENTVSMYYSATKIVNGIIAAILVDRGLLEWTTPVSKYWPEFGKHGKDKLTVEELLSHQAACPIIEKNFNYALIKEDPDELGKLLADQKPLWEPGSQTGYHVVTMGLYFDQVVRRVDPKKRSLQQFFDEEIAKPYGIDFFIGLPLQENYRCARVNLNYLEGWRKIPPVMFWAYLWCEITSKLQLGKLISKYETFLTSPNDPQFCSLGISSTHGFGPASAAAKMCGIIAQGDKHKRPMISKSSREKLFTKVRKDKKKDLFLHKPLDWGPGVLIYENQYGDRVYNILGNGGHGGHMIFVDPEFELGIAYVTNYLNPYHAFITDSRYVKLRDSLYECVRKLEGISEPIVNNWDTK